MNSIEIYRTHWKRHLDANATVGFPEHFGVPVDGRPRFLVWVPLGANLVERTQWRPH